MAAFKTLNSQDIIISPLEVEKNFSYKGNALTASDVGIIRYKGAKFNHSISTGIPGSQFSQSAVYHSIQQLYYGNYISSSNGDVQVANTASFNLDGTIRGRIGSNGYYNYPQTDLNPYRYFPTSSYTVATYSGSVYGQAVYGTSQYGSSDIPPTIGVLSIPKKMFGDQIVPKSVDITTPSGSYYDDGEGVLWRRTPLIGTGSAIRVGNVIYEHGMIILTGGTRKEGTGETYVYGTAEYGDSVWNGRTVGLSDIDNFVDTLNITCSFSSSFTIYETQYKCTIGQDEFNYSQNPTTISGSSNDGTVFNYVTSSFFSPYVTTVGMYNNNNGLVAVGKLAQPLPTSRTTDTTILVNIDRQ